MAALLDVEGFKTRTLMPSSGVEWLETKYPGYLTSSLETHSSKIRSRCRKRYADFVAPVPEVVLGWLVAFVQVDAYRKRGVNATDAQFGDVKDALKLADDELREAADAVDGLFDLPLREDTSADGITRGSPRAYSEASPYDHLDVQREALRGR